VVHDVRGPEQPDAVVATVEGVVGEVVGEEQEDEGPPLRRQLERADHVDRRVQRGGGELPGPGDEEMTGAHEQAGARVVLLVADRRVLGVLVRGMPEGERFEAHREEEKRDGGKDQRLHDHWLYQLTG
jgi:hypothetical protein